MDLALALGAGSVARMLAIMPVEEVADWRQYRDARGLPGRRHELYLGRIAQLTAGGSLDDFMLPYRAEAREEEPREQDSTVAAAALAGSGRVIRIVRGAK
ncbi:MAG: hypothetical protein ABIP42_07010 [Planctomycetota bacterium]